MPEASLYGHRLRTGPAYYADSTYNYNATA